MFLAAMHRQAGQPAHVEEPRAAAGALTHLLWFADGLLLFFLVPWIGTDLLRLDNDFYYAIFIWTALTFLFYYVRVTASDVLRWISARWRASLFAGVLAGTYVVLSVLQLNPTARPSGALLIFELLWRGVAYGVVDSLVLVAFPFAVALGFLGSHTVPGLLQRVALAMATCLLVWVMSTVHHLGFAQFNDENLATPQLSTAVVALPTIVTANPVGSIVAQTTLHLVVTFHSFESNVLVPPEVEFIPDYEPPGVFGPR